MNRYQVYLNPHSVDILDDFGKHVDITRSRLIQHVVDAFAQNLSKIFVATKTQPERKYILDSLVGAIQLKGNKKTNIAATVDDIYLHD